MKILRPTWLMLAVLCASCGPAEGPTPTETVDVLPVEPKPEEKPAEPKPLVKRYGAKLADGVAPVGFDLLVANIESHVSGGVLETQGVVRANCQVRGCWMEVRSEKDVSGPGLTVRFKDYGFFVPLTSRGAHVRIQGSIQMQALSLQEVESLEREGYTFASKEADGSAKIFTFIATGVEMWRPK